MITAGIVAEFDPLHNGHKLILQKARTLGADCVAVVMSGSAVQRGRLAVWDKYERAQAALRAGADIVLELPAPFSCSNAEVFARSAVGIFAALGEGTVDMLVFGSETDDLEALKLAAKAADELRDSNAVRALLSQGKSYPAAVAEAASELYGSRAALAMQSPNSILGIEYCRALTRLMPWCSPTPVLRGPASDSITSATEIRSLMQQGKDISAFVPEVLPDPCDMSRLDRLLLYSLFSAEKEDFLALPDVDEPLADRFIKAKRSCPGSAEEFIVAVKSKNITHARLRRAVLHLALGVKAEDITSPSYIRPIAFNSRGASLLSAAKPTLPLSTKLSELAASSPEANRTAAIEEKATLLRSLGTEDFSHKSDFSAFIKLTET
ncbi:MAG: nucleotidyltransferase family protein [Ruminococcus sp.]|nr:nucleotidyltransferase family protein [Ruminococcus sp.]